MNTTKSFNEMTPAELTEYWRIEDQKDKTVRKVLKVISLSKRLDLGVEHCKGITQKNAEKQFKNLMLGQFLLGSDSIFYLEVDYFMGKGKNASYSVSEDYRDYSNTALLSINLGNVREQIKEKVKDELLKSGYTFDIVQNMSALFEEYYNKNLERNNNGDF